jgi:hypothetical protein
MNSALDLTFDMLDDVEMPVPDQVAGVIAGAAFGLGVIGGAILAVAILT